MSYIQGCPKCKAVFPAEDKHCPSCGDQGPFRRIASSSVPRSAPLSWVPSAKQTAPQTSRAYGDWDNVVMSGLVAGVVFGCCKTHYPTPGWLLPTGLAYGFLVLNPNFRFGAAQKAVATILMLVIGQFGPDLLRALLAH